MTNHIATLSKLAKNGINLNYDDIVAICQKYKLAELSIFGSSIRDDFREDSDVDVLISYINVWDNDPWDFIDIQEDFERLVKRKVDVVDKDCLKNPIRRNNILANREVVYVNQ